MTKSSRAAEPVTAIRGAMLSYSGDPFIEDPAACLHYESDAIVAMAEGRIVDCGSAHAVAGRLPPETPVANYPDALIIAGFIDGHAHYPQTNVIAAHGGQLLDWLNEHTYPAEQRFGDRSHARDAARVFLQECLRAGTTTAAVFCTVHPESVDAFFEEAAACGMRMLAGKVLMDRNAPDSLLDTARRGYDESKALLLRWHGRGRLLYCVAPRFAATSSPAQLESASALWREHPGSYLQSHIAENRDEMAWVSGLHPDRSGYLDIYDHYDMLGPRAIYGHGIWLTDAELSRCHETGTALAHCPTSNTFLGSGLFKLHHARSRGRSVRVALATDVGAGTSFSMLATMHEAYKVAQLNGQALTARQAFYLATRGGAHALYLDDRIGSIAVGMEADVVVLDLKSTPLIAHRMQHCNDLDEALFIQMTLGDDRAVRATYIAGRLLYERPG